MKSMCFDKVFAWVSVDNSDTFCPGVSQPIPHG